jgi:DNA-binding MltR family transcriptional regulator
MHREKLNPDDRETDIADDPLLNAISRELHAINKRSDMKLLIALALNLAVVVLFARLHIKSIWFDLSEAAVVVTIIGG